MNVPGEGERRLLSIVDGDQLRQRAARACSTRTSFSRRTASARSRASTRTSRIVLRAGRHRVPGGLRARRIQHRPVRRQLQLARADLVPGELSADRIAAEVPSLLGDDFKVECPTGSGQYDDVVGSGRGDLAPPDADLPRGRGRQAAGARRQRAVSATIRTGGTWCCSTNTSTATTARASAPATRPAGPAWWPSCCSRAGSDDG